MRSRAVPPVSRRDRPAKPPLTRAGIVAVAVRVMHEEGLERATMRRIAQELDTGPASLYVYVQNVAELHGAVLDDQLATIDLQPDMAPAGAPDRLVDLLTAFTMVLLAHPSLARSLLTLRPSGPNYLRLIDALLGLLLAGGTPVREAAWGVDILLQHATAVAAEQGTRAQSATAGAETDELARALGEVPADELPHIARTADELLSGTGAERLRWSFRALISGIASTPAHRAATDR
ncbi:TetR/AcrR family transcriptional regulator [Pseudonocardia sp. GCM10023141]|uniref:TetR/AcrR family transcriptional regulator n=1 Tax=Pseudonocardia sp. GCM10023141 TaxID=3252653 RepID=UPI00360E3051